MGLQPEFRLRRRTITKMQHSNSILHLPIAKRHHSVWSPAARCPVFIRASGFLIHPSTAIV